MCYHGKIMKWKIDYCGYHSIRQGDVLALDALVGRPLCCVKGNLTKKIGYNQMVTQKSILQQQQLNF
jgi:hypothetical protein